MGKRVIFGAKTMNYIIKQINNTGKKILHNPTNLTSAIRKQKEPHFNSITVQSTPFTLNIGTYQECYCLLILVYTQLHIGSPNLIITLHNFSSDTQIKSVYSTFLLSGYSTVKLDKKAVYANSRSK